MGSMSHPVSVFYFIKQISSYARAHWSITEFRWEYINSLWRFIFARTFENYFLKAVEHFFGVYIASSQHSGAGRILESYVSRSLPTLLVFRWGYVSTKKVLYCLRLDLEGDHISFFNKVCECWKKPTTAHVTCSFSVQFNDSHSVFILLA